MVVSALVVTLPDNATARCDVLARLARDPRIEIGDPIDDRLPIVTETGDARQGAELVEELSMLPGVRVDVIAVDFGEAS
jgi:hypothetical protein